MTWHAVGFGCLGLAIGVLGGLSRSPVVATLLPLLFGLVSGASGVYVARAELTSNAGRARLAELGKVLTIFSLAVVAGSLYGVLLRTGAPASALIPHSSLEEPARFEAGTGISLEDRLRLVGMRTRLRLLGAEKAEQERILTLLAARLEEPRDDSHMEPLVAKLADAVDQLIEALGAKLPGDAGEEPPDEIQSLKTSLANGLALLREEDPDPSLTREYWRAAINEIAASNLDVDWISRSRERYRAAALVRVHLAVAQRNRPAAIETSELDRLLSFLGANSRVASEDDGDSALHLAGDERVQDLIQDFKGLERPGRS
jgi:hypothetical protein